MMASSGRFALGLAVATLACGDIAAPVRSDLYEWRLIVPATPPDTLSYHWAQADLPIRVWVENTAGLPEHMDRAIAVWEAAFLYGEFRGTLVDDSTGADVIVLGQPPAGPKLAQVRLHSALAPECAGSTDLDIDVAASQLRLPIRVSVSPRSLPDEPATERCLALTSIHELGHALGIFAHSEDPTDIMYTDPVVELPSARDRRTAEAVYHTPPSLEVVGP